MNDACLIQIACGAQQNLLQLSIGRHKQYCERHGFDYRYTAGKEVTQEQFSRLWFDAVGKAIADGYQFIVFLDADAWVHDLSVDLRTAVLGDGFGATWHSLEKWPDDRCYDHFNIGAFYMRPGPRAREAFAKWSAADFTQHPWTHQHTFNQIVPKYLIVQLPHRWNLDPFHDDTEAYVRALHAYGDMEKRYLAMKSILAPEEESEETMDLEEAFVKGWELQLKGRAHQEEAGNLLRGVLEIKPDHEDALRQYGIWLCENGKPDEAETFLRAALDYDPNCAPTWGALGSIYSKRGRDAEAIYALDRALSLATNMPTARYTRATPNLRLGRWREGWQDYQFAQVTGLRARRFQQPEWDGWSVIEGKTLYVWSEQGFGDMFMALQLLAAVRSQFKPSKIVLEVPRELCPLLKESFCLADEVVPMPSDYREMRPFDAHCSLMSLPAILSLTPEDLPAATNYIVRKAPETRSEALRIGVCWKGRPEHENDRYRSMKADDLAPVVALKGADVFPLTPEEGNLRHWGETADLIATLDYVVTVDTAVAHLAGAMGVPTFVMLPAIPDFRWMLERTDSPWYPSVTLFRQSVLGEWGPVIAAVLKRVKAQRISELRTRLRLSSFKEA